MIHLLLHEIKSRKWGIIGWCIGLTIFCLMYISIYPEMQEQLAGFADIAIYEAFGAEVSSFEGYIASSVIGLIPLLLGVYAIMTSTFTLAGEEERGTLELLLASHLKRWQIVVAKGLGISAVLTIILLFTSGVATVVFMAIQDQVATDVTAGQFFLVVMSCLPLVLTFAMIGLFFGGMMPTRKLGLMAGLLVLVWSYFGENIGNMLDSLAVIKPFSLFNYFDSTSAVFLDGIASSDILILLGLTALFFVLAIVAFQKRDVTVGNWPWQRVRLK